MRFMTRKLAMMVKNRPHNPTMSAVRNPVATQRTASTMTTAATRLTMKPTIDSSTRVDCQEMRSSSIPMGRSDSSSRIRASIASPTFTTLAPETLVRESPIAIWPSYRISATGGSTLPRRTVPTSPIRVSSRTSLAPPVSRPRMMRSAISSGDENSPVISMRRRSS